ncbi:RrF2 family transcriptional regulator [Pelagibacterium lacus]|uniref:Rrf2 family transcriptional regulator n=1 Tax=Pelagibacterium lacus TaxID=2282655 RepID=A0A369W3Y1_9HYPH|nr:Rrf2 family transcriptional regulator [Pelagibacterium lacus]RDE08585.1 Rrf2 family transcriptional regulator [Pelagibacterium lacus]
MISQKARYAFRALIALSRRGEDEPVAIGELARTEDIPQKFLEQILLDLKRSGLVASRRGKVGGYMLIKDPREIFFGEVLRVIDGPIAPLPCLSKIAYRRCVDCKNEDKCEVRRVFAQVAVATRMVLDSTSLADARDGNIQDITETYKISA